MQKIFGRKPILEALKSNTKIEQIYLQYGTHGPIVDEIKKLAKKKNIKITQLSSYKFIKQSEKRSSQGIVGIRNDFHYSGIDDILRDAEKFEFPLLLLLDSIQDPHNLGAIIRTADCSAVNGIITTIKNSAAVNKTVEKTSAGATNYVKIARVNNMASTLDLLKQNGYWIVGSLIGDSMNYAEIDYKIPIALLIGNEEKGIRRLIAKKCDFLAEIPMKGNVQSLNVSVATGILLFEILRQRSIK